MISTRARSAPICRWITSSPPPSTWPGRLFGLKFEERFDVDLPHPDARAWEVEGRARARHVALFIGDFFARPEKHSGAWMSAFRDQHRLDGEAAPIVVNVLNAARGAEGRAGAAQP